MQTSDKMSSDTTEKELGKPAIPVGHSPAGNLLSPEQVLPGAPPRGPRRQSSAPDHHKLASKVDLRLTAPLRAVLTEKAKAEGVTDGALIRRYLADALGVEAEEDRVSAPRRRIPDANLVTLSNVVRDVGSLYGPLRAGKVEEVIAGLDRIRGAVLPMVIGLNARSS